MTIASPPARPSRAMVLAAGLGTRMRPLTETRPKPLIEVAGRALLDHVLDPLEQAGVEVAVVNVHYLADQIEEHLARRARPHIIISDERSERLESGGGVRKAIANLGQGPFFVLNADSFWIDGPRSNLRRMAETFDPTRMDVLLLVAATATATGYDGNGDFCMGADGRLERRRERYVAPFVYAGVAIMTAACFAGMPEGPFSLNRVFDAAAKAGRLYGLRLDGFWLHVGTPAGLAAAEARLAQGDP